MGQVSISFLGRRLAPVFVLLSILRAQPSASTSECSVVFRFVDVFGRQASAKLVEVVDETGINRYLNSNLDHVPVKCGTVTYRAERAASAPRSTDVTGSVRIVALRQGITAVVDPNTFVSASGEAITVARTSTRLATLRFRVVGRDLTSVRWVTITSLTSSDRREFKPDANGGYVGSALFYGLYVVSVFLEDGKHLSVGLLIEKIGGGLHLDLDKIAEGPYQTLVMR